MPVHKDELRVFRVFPEPRSKLLLSCFNRGAKLKLSAVISDGSFRMKRCLCETNYHASSIVIHSLAAGCLESMTSEFGE